MELLDTFQVTFGWSGFQRGIKSVKTFGVEITEATKCLNFVFRALQVRTDIKHKKSNIKHLILQ